MRGTGPATRERIVREAYRLFRRVGFARAGVDEIAAAAGVTKRTLYQHFPSKDALLAEVLEGQAPLAAAAFANAYRRLGSAHELVETVFDDLAAWSRSPRWAGSGFTRAAIELADLKGHPALLAARRHKAEMERLLANALARAGIADSEALARELFLIVEGVVTLMVVHRDTGYAEAGKQAALRLIGADGVRTSPVPDP
jgi:AcrR family transcriptional regulator